MDGVSRRAAKLGSGVALVEGRRFEAHLEGVPGAGTAREDEALLQLLRWERRQVERPDAVEAGARRARRVEGRAGVERLPAVGLPLRRRQARLDDGGLRLEGAVGRLLQP